MQLDVADLRDFYASRRGQVVRRLVAARIRDRWTKLDGRTLVGIGYAAPYLGAFRGEVRRLGAFMPATQGALVWPSVGQKLTVLTEEERLPLPDNTVDNLLVVHGLETAGRVRRVLREYWRVLAPEGRILVVVPNRRGIWARTELTPFGYGRPYSRTQLATLLEETLFSPLYWGAALYVPPVERALFLRTAVGWERIGARVMPGFAGLIIVEAQKELIAPVGKPRRARVLTDMISAGGRILPAPGGNKHRD